MECEIMQKYYITSSMRENQLRPVVAGTTCIMIPASFTVRLQLKLPRWADPKTSSLLCSPSSKFLMHVYYIYIDIKKKKRDEIGAIWPNCIITKVTRCLWETLVTQFRVYWSSSAPGDATVLHVEGAYILRSRITFCKSRVFELFIRGKFIKK